jgi:LemA protein
MKRSLIVPLVLVGLVAIVGFWAIGFQRSMTTLNEEVAAQWKDVGTRYQERADLTKNLVATIKGSAEFENKTLREVVEARAKATSITLSADALTPENIARFEQAQAQFTGALSRMLATIEQYPTLQTTKAFQDFMVQYEGMEHRIARERMKYNEAVKSFNIRVKQFPGNMLAGMFGFTEKGYFESAEGTENAPEVDFTTTK